MQQSKEAQKLGVDYYPSFESSKFVSEADIIVFAVPLLDFEESIQHFPPETLRGKLIVDTCVLNCHPKAVMLRQFGNYPDIDVVTTHPMIAAVASTEDNPYASSSWDGRPMVYDKIRISDVSRFERYLKIFSEARCQLVEMSAEQHDESIANAEFVTHLTGRLLADKQLLPPSPVVSKEYAALCDVADVTAGDSFDLFFGMFKYNDRAKDHIVKMRENLSRLERQLAAKEAYLAASTEMRNSDRQRLLAETKMLLREIMANGDLMGTATGSPETSASPTSSEEVPKESKSKNQNSKK